ncbi:hypothetical protein GQ53DRAFT_881205 [Thozetella sp. PMI_491]|nr:hypothetical protein GQ53DRAFT_881205 [Thozetella sp. PMI_491]
MTSSTASTENNGPWPHIGPVSNSEWYLSDLCSEEGFLLGDNGSYGNYGLASLTPAAPMGRLPAVSLRSSSYRNNTGPNASRLLPGRPARRVGDHWPHTPVTSAAESQLLLDPDYQLDQALHHGLPQYIPNFITSQSTTHQINSNPMILPLLPTSGSLSTFGSFPSAAASDLMDPMMLDDMELDPLSAASSAPSHMTTSSTVLGLQTNAAWNYTSPAIETTVSPKLLKLRPSPTPNNSSTESLQASFFAGGADQDSPHFLVDFGTGARGEVPTPSFTSINAPAHEGRPRRQLPDKPRYKALQAKTESTPPSPKRGHRAARPPKVKSSPKAQLRPAPTSMRSPESDRNAKDEFLVQSKRAGMTYKEIRRKGGFAEAESTLRGRYRTLTKSKEARVRKPEWTEIDLYLLEQAVRNFARGDDLRSARIPWKQVAEHIYANGGTYLFGNSTCRKRWDELVAEEEERGGNIDEPFFHSEEEDEDFDCIY